MPSSDCPTPLPINFVHVSYMYQDITNWFTDRPKDQ